ncbi:MAG: alcohol dehydrogenase catalytic domain-containing protein [Burkholderiales bacterium]|nr:alcohol dehydrogenase catalytic domain-containing protein [Burkholderiales bacterium]
MKALVYTAPNEVTYRDEPEPVRGEGEAVLRIDAVGICGSDMHAFHGRDPRRVPPLILGHEFCGTIVAGPGQGKRVTGNPLITCGTCEYCVQGRNNLCANRTMVGMTRAGAFAERMSIPATSLVEMPQDMDPVKAALTEPAATALHALDLATRAARRPLPELALYVIGGGAIGLLTALLARSYGCRRIVLAETNPLRRASAERAAGCRVLDPLAGEAPADGSIDLVIDAVGGGATRKAALAAVKPGGVVLHVGLQDWASEIDMRKLTLAEVTLIGTYTYSTADLRATVKALAEGAFGDLAWVETRPLADGARAFDDLDKGRSAAAKIVLTPA